MLATPSKDDRSFVYVSAAEVFVPLVVPERYISTKREAEGIILSKCTPENHVKPVIVRPGECGRGRGASVE